MNAPAIIMTRLTVTVFALLASCALAAHDATCQSGAACDYAILGQQKIASAQAWARFHDRLGSQFESEREVVQKSSVARSGEPRPDVTRAVSRSHLDKEPSKAGGLLLFWLLQKSNPRAR